MNFLRKYNTATAAGTHVRVPIITVSAATFSNSSNWTPASGDVYVSKNGGTQTAINSLPVFVNGAWEFAFTASETTAKTTEVAIVDFASKGIEDQFFIIETFGNASAMYPIDLSDSVRMGLTALPNAAADAAGGLPISDAGGLDLDTLNSNLTATKSSVTAIGSQATQINSRVLLVSSNGVTIVAVKSLVTAIGSQATSIGSRDTQINSRVSQIGVAGAGLTDLGGMSTTMKAQVNSEAYGAVIAAPIASLVWDTVLTSHVAAGTTGYALNAAGAAGDPWSTAVPGAYGAGTAGNILGNRLDLAISTRLASGPVLIQGTKTSLDSLQDISKADVNSEVYAAVGSLGYTSTRAGYLDSIITRQPSGAVLIQGTKTTLDSLQDISEASVNSQAWAAVASYGPALASNYTSTRAGYLDSIPTRQPSGAVLIQGTKTTLDSLQDITLAQVNSTMVGALSVDTYAEPGQGAPGATIALSAKIGYLFKAWRNRTVVTSTNITLYADDGTTADQKLTHSDSSSGYIRGEMGTGA